MEATEPALECQMQPKRQVGGSLWDEDVGAGQKKLGGDLPVQGRSQSRTAAWQGKESGYI